MLADLGERVGDGNRSDQTKIDTDLGELGTFVNHRQNRAVEGCEVGLQRLMQWLARVGSAHNDPLGLAGALDRASKHQRFDLVVNAVRRKAQGAGKSWRHL